MTASAQTDPAVANTILEQIGGERSLFMLGCPQAGGATSYTATSLTIRIKNNPEKKVNRITITLDPTDTYSVRFWRHSPQRFMSKSGRIIDSKYTTVSEHSDIYCDGLMDLIEDKTGWFLTLSRRG